MSASVNKVILIGNCVRDPEIRNIQSGGKVANLSVATSERWRDKVSGEQKEKSEFHKVSIFNDNVVSVVERFVKKGSKLYLEGQLSTRDWTDKDGNKRYSTEINIGRFNGSLVLLDSKREGAATPERPQTRQHDPERETGELLGDDIPF